ncbi:MAG: response regulator [Gemmatimonadota bacterium]|nr:response regulator [Gemmatimonadota bacterium]MDE3171532.1 response regulator [Gemmatimonadota bacterium]
MKVLIADDDATIQALVRAVVVSLGYEPVEAADGGDAWERYRNERFPLAVVDIEMPDMDGLELCRRIRGADPDHESFILVLTGRNTQDDLGAVLEAGADDYIAKPTSPSNLRARLVIARRRMEQEAQRRAAEAELARARWLAGIGETSIALQHEINNPLSALLGHAELMMMDEKERGEENEHVRVIHEQARRIADVMKRLRRLRDPRTVEYVAGARMLDLSHPPYEEP